MPAEVVVVGGGIAGCTVAYELARRGLRVVLVERDSIAEAASGRNMGLLLNQTEPEVVRIMRRSLDVYRELLPGPVGFDLRETKQLLFAADEAQLASVRSRSAEIAAIGVEVEEVGEMDLPFEMRCVGGFIVHNAWALEPADATRAFAEAARQAGAELRVGVRAGHVQVASGRVHGVVTDAGPLACDAVVLAAGRAGVGVAAAWFGLRPMTPDGMPIVGRLEVEGLYAHGGHGSIGMMAAPATARWLAAAMSGEAAPELAGLRPDRFQE